MNDPTKPLEDARAHISQVDRDLIHLLKRRMQAVQDVAAHKSDHPEISLFDPEREAQVAKAWSTEAERLGLSGYFTGRILREVLNYSRRSQEPLLASDGEQRRTCRVGYQGVPCSYSDLAIGKLFTHRGPAVVDRCHYPSFTEVVDALDAGEIDYALLPVENTLVGSISEVNHLLVTRDLAVVDEEAWDVTHCLVGLEGARPTDLREIRSHPVALQQCQRLLGDLPAARPVTHFDTAGAAQSVRDGGDPAVGAICSAEAAERFGLTILRRDVADRDHNETRFLLLARHAEPVRVGRPVKTSVTFTVDDRCGALAGCLQVFAEHDVNLTRLESRPQPEAPWEYLFLADLQGHQDEDDVHAALAALRQSANHVRVLGTYPSRSVESRKVVTPVTPAPVRAAPTLHAPREDGERTRVTVSGVEIGGGSFTLILGPCAVENEDQIQDAAAMVKARGARLLRGGAFKPRSSPYSFQGLGLAGLDLLVAAGRRYELPVVTEVLKPEDVAAVAERADMLQVGARSMQNFALLQELGRVRRPVLLKRGMSATLKELLQAAEYIMAGGNQRVVLCERGIRTFETATRNTLDLSAVPVLKGMSHLPVIVDPSHAAGVRHLVVPLALAAAAVGADGLIVECHPRPDEALCDKDQALTEEDLDELIVGLEPILASQGRSL